MCNSPIPFLAQNDGESIGNLNYRWHQVSILRMCGMENNILSVAINPSFVISKQKDRNYWFMVEGKCQEITYFSSAMLRQKVQLLYQSILCYWLYIVKECSSCFTTTSSFSSKFPRNFLEFYQKFIRKFMGCSLKSPKIFQSYPPVYPKTL